MTTTFVIDDGSRPYSYTITKGAQRSAGPELATVPQAAIELGAANWADAAERGGAGPGARGLGPAAGPKPGESWANSAAARGLGPAHDSK